MGARRGSEIRRLAKGRLSDVEGRLLVSPHAIFACVLIFKGSNLLHWIVFRPDRGQDTFYVDPLQLLGRPRVLE